MTYHNSNKITYTIVPVCLGYLHRQKVFSVSGSFDVMDANGSVICALKSGLAGLKFAFVSSDGIQLASVARKWAGLGKELLTGADDHLLRIDEAVPDNSVIRQLIFASVICINLVAKIDIP